MDEFIKLLCKQVERKAKLYDGINQTRTTDQWLRFSVEELGEVSSALTRERYELAKVECIDLAHAILCLYLAIEIKKNEYF